MIEKFYLGTYTKKISRGIYSIKLDTEKKELFDLKLEYEVNNPTYLTMHKNNIFSVSNMDNLGGVSYFKNKQLIATSHSEIATPCYIAYNNENKYLLTANYHAGSVILYKVENNKITLLDEVKHSGHSINKSQKEAHVHYSNFSPNKKFIIVCDLGLDKVITYKIKNNSLEKVAEYNCAPGSGARHITFHPTKNIAYLICELSSTIEVLKFEKETGIFEKKETISLIKEEEQKWAAAIRVTKDGKFLYASNRGKDLLIVFEIKNDACLKHIQTIETFGSVARDFNFSSDDKFLLVGHQESNNLTLFERNIDGSLKLIQKDVFAPEVVNITQEIFS